MAAVRAKDAILDGEMVCLDGDGRSQFLELMRRRRAEAVFYAFDLLWHNGEDLRKLPLIERKRRLKRLIRASHNPAVLMADHIERDGVRLFEAIRKRDCEGIIAKHKLAPYVKTPATWFKVLNPDYTQKRSRREMFEKFNRGNSKPLTIDRGEVRTRKENPLLPLARDRKTRTDTTVADDLTAKPRTGGTSRR